MAVRERGPEARREGLFEGLARGVHAKRLRGGSEIAKGLCGRAVPLRRLDPVYLARLRKGLSEALEPASPPGAGPPDDVDGAPATGRIQDREKIRSRAEPEEQRIFHGPLSPQDRRHLEGGGRTLRRVDRDEAIDEARGVLRDLRGDLVERRRCLVQPGGEQAGPSVHVRELARQRLVEHEPQRIQIRPFGDGAALELLGRHVRRGPEHLHVLLRVPREGAVAVGDPEVEEANVLVVRHEDVRRLEIPMNDERRVDAAQRLEEGDDDLGDVGPRAWHRHPRKRQPRHELHHDEGLVPFAPVVEELDDAGEPLAEGVDLELAPRAIDLDAVEEELHRHEAARHDVHRRPDSAERPPTEHLAQPVAPGDRAARGELGLFVLPGAGHAVLLPPPEGAASSRLARSSFSCSRLYTEV